MSSARDHHAKAEQLLEQARSEQDNNIRRSQILAEAQVHATLALSAAPATVSPDPGVDQQRETSNTASTTEGRTGSAWSEEILARMGTQEPVPPPPFDVAPDDPADEAEGKWHPGSA